MSDSNTNRESIPESHYDLLEQPLVMSLATTLSDSTPQVTPVWYSFDNGDILFNSAKGRLKDRAIRENPYVAIVIVDPTNMYRYLAVRGPIVEITEEGAHAHIDQLSKRYTGREKYNLPEGETRVIYRLQPEHVLANG